MLRDDAKKVAAEIGERINTGSSTPGVQVTVKSNQVSPDVTPAGAGRPIFINYYIHVDDGTRMATLPLGQATGLLDDIEPGWDADRLFAAIEAREVPIDDSTTADSPAGEGTAGEGATGESTAGESS